jgi:dTDP-4-dehydrorhamnose reductase
MSRTLVIGSTGYLGGAFLRNDQLAEALPQDLENACSFPTARPLSAYSHVMIAAPRATPGRCEEGGESLRRLHVEGTLRVAEQFAHRGVTPIVFSSDYVFDGETGGYIETSQLAPLNAYGRQKAQIEQALGTRCRGNYLLIRLGKVFSVAPRDGSLLHQIASSLRQREKVRAAYDQLFCPILLDDVIQGVRLLQARNCTGVFNLCGSEIWTRLDLARCIAATLRADPRAVQPISLDDLRESFRRPKKTVMCCDKFERTTGMQLTPVSACIRRLEER